MAAHLQGGDALLSTQDGEEVVSERVSNVLGPVVVRSLMGNSALDSEALQEAKEGKLPCK